LEANYLINLALSIEGFGFFGCLQFLSSIAQNVI